MIALLAELDQPIEDDPLAAFLQVEPLRPTTPPWLRLFRLSHQTAPATRWTHNPEECPRCAASVRMNATFRWRATTRRFTLCLNCGEVTVTHQEDSRPASPPIAGHQWSPPCLPVKLLRRTLLPQRPPFPFPFKFPLGSNS
jgi:hypothetical protein